MLARRIIKKKSVPVITQSADIPVVKRVIGKIQRVKAQSEIVPQPQQAKRVITPRKVIPPPPAPGVYVTKAMEAFEAIREYYTQRGQTIPQSDIKWFKEELAQEKKEYDEFWARHAVTKACIDGTLRGDDDWTITLAMNAAKQQEKKLPILESDIGPMPAYGTGEFWAWCHKRKQLKLQKEAAIIAAGGTVPPAKSKKPRAKKAEKLAI